MSKISIGFISQPDFEGNSKALYEYMDKNIEDIKLIWFVHSDDNKNTLNSKKTEVVCITDSNFIEKFQSCEYIISTHNELLDFKTPEQIYIDLWHGVGLKKMGYLESINREEFKDHTEFYEKVAEKVDFIISPSEMNRIIFSSLYNINILKTLEYGQPRYDYLTNSDGLSKLSILTGRNDLGKFNKIFIYLPTYKKGFGRIESNSNSDNILNLESYDESELLKFLKDNNYYLVIKAHPFEEAAQNVKEDDNIFYIQEDKMRQNFISLNEILNATDLLITDYCSIYSDYAILDRPILFVHGDHKEYFENRGLWFNNNMEFWFPGPRSLNINDFKSDIKKLLEDTNYYKLERNRYNTLMNNNNKDVCQKLATDIINGNIQKLSKFNKESLNNGIRKIKSENEELLVKVDGQNVEIEEYKLKLKTLEEEKTNIENVLNEMQNSNSWKLTKPIRNVSNMIKKIENKN